jgi:hypothetical protein
MLHSSRLSRRDADTKQAIVREANTHQVVRNQARVIAKTAALQDVETAGREDSPDVHPWNRARTRVWPIDGRRW